MTSYSNNPLKKEPDGTYITEAQMRFFLNRKNGSKLYFERSDEFVEYYDICRVYNLVSDIMLQDSEAAILYWDEDIEAVSIAFPSAGKAARAIGKIKPHYIEGGLDDTEEDDDPWGLLIDQPWDE